MPREPAFLWSAHPETCEVGLGSACVCEASGSARLPAIIEQAEDFFRNYQGVGLGASAVEPRFYGGFSTVPMKNEATHWRDFADAEFMLPQLLYRTNTHQASLTLFISRAGLLDPQCRKTQIDRAQALIAMPSEYLQDGSQPPISLMRRTDNPNRECWNNHVAEACRLLRQGGLEKVVLAREMLLSCSSKPDAVGIMDSLLGRRDGSVCFALRRGSSTFLGATPERLVTKRGSQIVTEALAGSAATSDPEAMQSLLSGDKDRLEHSLVVREIVARLKGLGADVALPGAPELRQFGPLVHLHTLLTASKLAAPHLLILGEHLHPTPAVGGIPVGQALEFIRTHETFDRGRYASPIGWFDRNGDGELAIALRAGLLSGREVRLYAGAGLVTGSQADAEWRETELKFRTFLDALGLKTAAGLPSQAC
jgi:menaquinone-specific isochorismate synthase